MQRTSGKSPARNLRNSNSSGAHFLPLLAFVLTFLGITPASVLAQAPNVTYKGPLVITQGGTYSGNYRSNDSNTPVIKIETTQPVIIENSILVGAGDLISANGGGANLTVRNNQGFGLTPTVDNRGRGRFLAASSAKNLQVIGNYMEHTTGFTIYQWTGDGSPSQTVKILRNKAKNIDGRRRNGGFTMSNFIGLNRVSNVANIEVAWNQVMNEPDVSSVEDNINFYNSGGTSSSPARVHNNYVQGAYPLPATNSVFSGTGFTTDGDGNTASSTAAFIQAYDNQFVSICNAAMNIAAGHDIRFYNNRMVTSGYLPDGRKLNGTYAATAIFNAYQMPSSVFYGNSVQNNIIGYVKWGYKTPFQDRHDLSIGACASCTGTNHLPNPITLQSEQGEFALWQQKLQQNGITLGAGGTNTTPTTTTPTLAPANQAPTVTLATSTSVTVNTALSLAATAADADGSVAKVEFFNGSSKLGEDASAPYQLSWTPTVLGTLSLSARATDNAGATTTSAVVSVNVTAGIATTNPAPAPSTATFVRAININGGTMTLDGNKWEASSGASGVQISGSMFANQNVTLTPATDAARAQMIRSSAFSRNLVANVNVSNGTYLVYAYVWEDNSTQTYTISLEGQAVRSNFISGSAGRWERLGPFTANVTDGNITLATSGGDANLSGIEIWKSGTGSTATTSPAPTTTTTAPAPVPAPTTVAASAFYRAINFNGTATTLDGNEWEGSTASNYSTNGRTTSKQTVVLNPATTTARAQMIRSSVYSQNLSFTMTNVPNGTYDVYAYIWEDNHAQTVSFTINGQTALSDYNTGSAGSWKKVGPYAVSVTNGTIQLNSSGGDLNLSGIEVWSKNATTAFLPTPTSSFASMAAILNPTPVVSKSVSVTHLNVASFVGLV